MIELTAPVYPDIVIPVLFGLAIIILLLYLKTKEEGNKSEPVQKFGEPKPKI